MNHQKEYLNDLLEDLRFAFENNKTMTFKIVEPKEKGFLIQVGGLFGYLSFLHMPWEYKKLKYWQNVSPFLIDKVFTCKIHSLEEGKLVSIFITAKQHEFETPRLTEFKKYRGVLLEKTQFGFFVDIGLHFGWKFGSLLGLVHKSTLIDASDYENTAVGNEISVIFQGYNNKQDMILGDNRERAKWHTGALDKLIGTIQNVSVVINENGHREFYVQGKHKAKVPVTKEHYPQLKAVARTYISGLEDGDTIDCEVVRINNKRDMFVLRLLIEPAAE